LKRILIAVLTVVLAAGLAHAKPYEVSRKAGEYTVNITMDKNPPSVGMNTMEIAIADKSGRPVKDARVLVDYGMPAMPGMPAMFYKADGTLSGERYTASLNISMKGPWHITIKITHQGKTVSTKFTFDVT
jgi:hypothetical protein